MTEAAPSDTPVEKLSFEDAIGELEKIVRELETGKAPLDQSIAYYERGVTLKRHCDKKLKEAQSKIEKIHVDEKGKVRTEPLDPES